jgi:hypothetical protein
MSNKESHARCEFPDGKSVGRNRLLSVVLSRSSRLEVGVTGHGHRITTTTAEFHGIVTSGT